MNLKILFFRICILSFSLGFSNLLFAATINHIEYGATNHAGQNSNFNSENGFHGQTQSVGALLVMDGDTKANAGRIYLNDIDVNGLIVAANYLEKYLNDLNIDTQITPIDKLADIPDKYIEIVLVPGDFTKIDIPLTKTANLRNPAPTVFSNLTYGSYRPEKTQLARMIKASEEGLKVTMRYEHSVIVDYNAPPDAFEILKNDFNNIQFTSTERKVNEIYHDYSARSVIGTQFESEGEVLKGDYSEFTLTENSKVMTCKKLFLTNQRDDF